MVRVEPSALCGSRNRGVTDRQYHGRCGSTCQGRIGSHPGAPCATLLRDIPGLTADILAADQVFRVTLADGRDLVLRVEFQGRRSHPPMPWRMLGYMRA